MARESPPGPVVVYRHASDIIRSAASVCVWVYFPLRHCLNRAFSRYCRAYVIWTQAVSIPFDRTQVAATLGRTTDFSRLEPGRNASTGPPVRPSARAGRQDPDCGTSSTKV